MSCADKKKREHEANDREEERANKSKGLIFSLYFRALDCNFLYFPYLYKLGPQLFSSHQHRFE